MGSKSSMDVALLTCSVVLVVFGNLASSDLAKDREECANQLVGLAPCLPYVGGEAKTPTIDCCSGLKQVVEKSMKCLCVLIKDRNDPDLGITFNATLALHLPSSCHTPANISHCLDLLHLAPNSPEAKVFQGFDKAAQSTPAAPTGKGPSPSSNITTPTSDAKSHGGVSLFTKRWLVAEVLCVILPSLFIFLP
ncbi:protein YLS3-like [Senna tora]|uniref:Protein YLS3-like n=1 Tax=Senna tora TaxID=362788 RepID=A0A834X313_9FABA|nr:protein YLS3-like [Senna tora]